MKSLVSCSAIALVLCSCGGSLPAMPPASAKPSAGKADVQFTISIPRVQTGGKARYYISKATQSIAVNGAGFNTSPSSPGCTTDSGSLVCTISLEVYPGSSVPFYIQTFDRPLTQSGQTQGDQLSAGSTTATIQAGAANIVRVTLDGTPASVKLVIANPSPPIGTAATIPMTVTAYDAGGYLIVGPYSSEILFTTPPNATGIAYEVNGQTSPLGGVASSSDTVAIQYPGHGAVNTVIQAYLQFGAAGRYLGTAPFTPQPAFGEEIKVGASLVGASAWQSSDFKHELWFTEPAKAKLAVYTPGSGITEYATPSGNMPERIYADPLRFWFTESNNSLGLYYNAGNTPTIGEYPLSSPNVGVYQIGGADQDNNLYFTEKNVGKIGKFSPNHQLTEFSTGNANSTPAGMTYGGDSQSFVFADRGADAIGRVTFAGGVTYYPVPTAAAQPTEISQEFDTELWWFTEPGASQIGSIDSNGNIKEYASPGIPVAIVADQPAIFVLTKTGTIEEYDPATGNLLKTLSPPASSNGPVVGIFDGITGQQLGLLRSDGTNGSIQSFFYY